MSAHFVGDAIFVSIPFRADTGFELQLVAPTKDGKQVSIPFRADTGFEPERREREEQQRRLEFQSLSGLTLGLNHIPKASARLSFYVSIPFRADTGFERVTTLKITLTGDVFQSLSGLTLGLNMDMVRHDRWIPGVFQSLSGLTLGLNAKLANAGQSISGCFNPFQG